MDDQHTLLVDAFTTEPLSGNVAGIVPDADGLDTKQIRALAAELGVSETAFVCLSTTADHRTRYFAPQQRVNLCGHTTIAAHAHLAAGRDLEPDTHTLETNVGTLGIELGDLGEMWMTQDTPTVQPLKVDCDHLAAALGVGDATLRGVGTDLPVAVASTGLPFPVIPVNFLEHLSAVGPSDATIADLAVEHDVAGFYAYTFDTIDDDSTPRTRRSVPGIGISEGSATGTAAGVYGAYLRQVGTFDSMPDELRLEQGHFVDRPGIVRVKVGAEIHVGGYTVQSFDGEIVVPEFADDDTIEA